MTTLPFEDEKDTRLISDMEFANDTTPEEKGTLRKWTKLFEEVRDLRLEIGRCTEVMTTIDDDKKALAHASHIKGMRERADKIDAEMKPLWAEYEKLRDAAEPVRKEKAERVRGLLKQAGLKTAQDIIDAGCTGLFAGLHFKGEGGIDEVKFIRENMGGARVSLPCYVGSDRYCLIHQTIGGLQIGQKALFSEYVPNVSRDLTSEEKGHVTLVENVRRREGNMRDGKAILTGQKIPEDLNVGPLLDRDAEFARQLDSAGVPPRSEFVPIPPFTCPEHGALAWGCRFCLAQAIANGPLEPVLQWEHGEGILAMQISPSKLQEKLDTSPADHARVYVRVASFKRKLAME